MRAGFAALLMLILSATAARAQPAGSTHRSHPVIWTGAGSAGGLALGTYVGLHVFDDDVDSEQQVWATAIFSAVACGAIAFMASRSHTPSPRRSPSRLTEAEVRLLSRYAWRRPQPRFSLTP